MRRTWYWWDREVLAATAYLLLGLPLAVFWVVALAALVPLGVALLVVWVGLLVLWALFHLVRGGAMWERRLLGSLMGVQVASPYRPDTGGAAGQRWRARLSDPATWRDLLYLVVRIPLGLIGFAVAWMAWWVPVAAVTLPLYVGRLPDRSLPLVPTPGRPVWRVESATELAVVAVLGLLFLMVLTPLLVRGAAHLHAALASALLGPTAGSLVAHARAARDHGAQAEAADRRRIERDLHDGAQARLVTLAMSLGRARQRFDSDPAGARALVDAAHEHAKQALVELRDLARGIHPAILADRGLNAALSALAARSPVPVVVTCPDRRFPDAVESAAYFVVAEALANVAKHAQATGATIRVSQRDGRLVVEVTDDGRGGADAGGAGLRGLADRVAALDGALALSSPAGGPTIVHVELPCGS